MIVADSSVWIAELRGLEPPAVIRLRQAVREDSILVGDLILLEVLQGARNDAHAELLDRSLQRFAVATMLDVDTARQAASNFRKLRERGITIRKTVDLIIGTFCIERGHKLLQLDRDFRPMAEHLGLQLV